MLAVLKVEHIGENYFTYRKQARERHERTERYGTYLGCNQSRAWCARLTGYDAQRRYIRAFVHGQIDYSQSNSTGSRGVYIYYALADGIYEVNERISWKHVRRYFIRVENTTITEITQEEVDTWLQSS